jgi:hypothetical protein
VYLWIGFFLYGQETIHFLSQNEVPTGASNCRIQPAEMKPLLSPWNPYVSRYAWNQENRVEKAWISSKEELVIAQRGCLRHHILLDLSIYDPDSSQRTLSYFLNKAIQILQIAFYQDVEYYLLREQLHQQLLRKLKAFGLNEIIEIDLADYTILCLFRDKGSYASVKIELIKFLHKEKILLPGVKEYEDDGWFQP